MSVTKKKTVIVVKEIKPISQKKEIFVSRPIKDRNEVEALSPINKLTLSPQKPLRSKDGEIVSRSILGDPANFERLENQKENATKLLTRPLESAEAVSSVMTYSPRPGTSASRLLTVGSKRALSGEQTQAILDPLSHPEVYIETMKFLQQKAKKILEREEKKEQAMTEFLPVNEKFSLNKEEKVLTRWQERQKSWERIQTKLAKRTQREAHSSMMGTIDEYRAKMEEYDILQAAIPPHERYGESSWEMSLRGGGDRAVPVGHVFSGLYCPVKARIKVPIMVRKPKVVDATRKSLSYIDETAPMKATRKRLNKYVEAIRPHSMTVLDAEGLDFQTMDLFDWAVRSSKDFFEQGINKQEKKIISNVVPFRHQSSAKSQYEKDEKVGPVMEFLSSKEITFTSSGDEVVHQTVSFRNTGNIVLTYCWRILPDKEPLSIPEIADFETDQGRVVKSALVNRDYTPREALVISKRESFFCAHDRGQALPGETVSTVFTYINRTGRGGIVSQTWTLEISPKCQIYFNQNLSSDGSSVASLPSAVSFPLSPTTASQSPLYVKFHGHTTTSDESGYKRLKVTSQLTQLSVRSFIQEIITQSVLRVRSPVTLQDIQQRQIRYFLDCNKSLLTSISKRFYHTLPLYQTTERFQIMSNLYSKLRSFHKAVRLRYSELKDDVRSTQALLVKEEGETLARRELLKRLIFPHKKVEIFDEIKEEDIACPWDEDFQRLMNIAEDSVNVAENIAKLEEELALAAAKMEKARLKAKRREEDSDYESEDEDEDDEEEDDDDKKNKPPPPEHSIVKYAKSLLAECHGKLHSLTLVPIPDLFDIVRESVVRAIDQIEDIAEECRNEADIALGELMPELPRAFHDPEGVEVWRKIVTGDGIDEVDGKGTKKAVKTFLNVKAKKKDSSGAVPVQQALIYRRQLYLGIHKALMDNICDGVHGNLDSLLEKDAEFRIQASPIESLERCAVLRREDIKALSDSDDGKGSIVFINFDGTAFTNKNYRSAFDVLEKRRNEAIDTIITAGECNASAVILLYETQTNESDPKETWSLLLASNIIQDKLNSYTTTRENENAKLLAKKKKNPPPIIHPPHFQVVNCNKLADLKLAMQLCTNLGGGKRVTDNKIPVLILETICESSKLVPEEPSLPLEVADDDEAPIVLGRSEAEEKRKADWRSQAPRNLSTKASILGITRDVVSSTDPLTALSELVNMAHGSPEGLTWIDGNTETFYQTSDKILPKLEIPNGRIVSKTIKQTLQWTCCTSWLRTRKTTELRDLFSLSTETPSPAFALEFGKLFPSSLTEAVPKFLAVIGGRLQADKFGFLDRLLDYVHTLFVGGQLAIPFLGLSSKITLIKYRTLCENYREMCAHIVKKARIRGVHLLLPEDLMVGDEDIDVDGLTRMSNRVDSESRDDGIEYPGDAKVMQLYITPVEVPQVVDKKGKKPVTATQVKSSQTHKKEQPRAVTPPPPVDEKYTVTGYVFDIGPKTCHTLQEEVMSSDLLLSWGTVGTCEVTGFQAGQRALITVASKKPNISKEPPADISKKPLRTLIIGESTVEWWMRMVDSDGEKNGDLVRYGIVSYMSRNSSILTGLIGLCQSPVFSNIRKRDLNPEEWSFAPPPPVIEDEEEEDDDDEEEDEDED